MKGEKKDYITSEGRIHSILSWNPFIMKNTHKWVSPVFIRRRNWWQKQHPWAYKYPKWLQL